MEAAVVGAFIQVLFNKLASPLLLDLKKFLRMEDDLEKLTKSVEAVQAVLNDLQRLKSEEESTLLWLRDLQETAYEFEDVVDELLYEARRHSAESSSGGAEIFSGRIRRRDRFVALFSPMSSHQVAFRNRVVGMIGKVSQRLQADMKRGRNLRIDDSSPRGGSSSSSRLARETSSLLLEPFVAARSSEKEQIVASLLSPGVGDGSLSVVPIVGIPGIGKTTLAQLVFNDDRVKGFFQPRMWVCVSVDFDVKRLTRQIFESATLEKVPEVSNLDVIQNDLSGRLQDKRFLLVLDDVWSKDLGAWQELRAPLLHAGKGSSILLTTRHPVVAKRMGTVDPLDLKGLSLGDCRQLLHRSTSSHLDLRASPVPDEICGKIVNGHDGAPLVVKTVGRILSSKAESRWGEILDSVIWEASGGEDSILPVLKRSYHDLPPHLKRCFAYCSLFPRQFEFERSKLVQLWIAQGYVISRDDSRRLEDVGNDYFEELLSKSFFRSYNSRYIMYDLFHNLTQHIPNQGCIRVENGNQKLPGPAKGVCHLSFSVPDFSRIVNHASQGGKLRSLIHINHFHSGSIEGSSLELPLDMLAKVTSLRVLDLSGSSINRLPKCVGSLIHLRLLDLSDTKIAELPDTISMLHNLYSLGLQECPELREISPAVANLVNLKHLSADRKLIADLPGIGKLTLLQELEQFVVSSEIGHDIGQLKNMNQLRGRLSIVNIENIRTEEEAEQADLKKKVHLDELILEWSKVPNSQVSNQFSVVDKLLPPPGLRSISFIENSGSQHPAWMTKYYSGNLRSILLRHCSWEVLPPLGTLPHLVTLKMEYLLSVQSIGSSFYGGGIAFPCLEDLEVRHMHSLKEWHEPAEHRSFPRLKKLRLEDCPELESLYLPEAVECLKVEKCPQAFANSGFALLQQLSSLPSFSCSFEDSYRSLQSCVEQTMRHLNTIQGLEIYFCDEHVVNSMWAQRPSWMPYSFARGRAADESSVGGSTYCIHDISDIRIFLLFANNFPEYRDVSRRDVRLHVRNFDSADSIGYNSLSGCLQGYMNSLKNLSLKGCQGLESLLGGEVLLHLSTLETLLIEDCLKMMALHWFPQQHNLSCLRILKIKNCPDLTALPEIKLTALEDLQIAGCGNLVSLELNGLISLRRMEIDNCVSLATKVFTCSIASLQELRLCRCSERMFKVDESEAGLQNLLFLEYLYIRQCNNLTQLPMNLKALSSLKYLSIVDCPAIQSFPETGLPEALNELCIEGCEILYQRCQVGGADWSMVARIPKKTINCPRCHPFRCCCNQG